MTQVVINYKLYLIRHTGNILKKYATYAGGGGVSTQLYYDLLNGGGEG